MEMLRTLIGPDDGGANIWQLCVRAVILFAVGIAYIRLSGRRTFSQASPMDIIVAIIVGSNLSRAMTGKAPFWAGLGATLLLVLLHRLFARLTLRPGWLSHVLKAQAVPLIRDGKEDRAAMHRHGISEADLLEGLRMEQVETVEEVRLASLENSGKISVIPKAGS
jgi:uncharacterized membrane protein YcaP (DUF421 family)